MSLWRHGEGKENEVKSPENERKKPDVGAKPICEGDKNKLTPNQEFKNKYKVPEDKLNKTGGNKETKPSETGGRPENRGNEGRERGFPSR